MPGFVKLFSSIVTSSLWCEDDTVLRVWIAMLATCDASGLVEGSIPGFANLARVPVSELSRVLALLESPDPHSRTPANEGRRIASVAGGWQILNYAAYRDRGQGKEGSRAPYMRARRHAKKCNATDADVTRYTEAEAEADVDVDVDAFLSHGDEDGSPTSPENREGGSSEPRRREFTKSPVQYLRFGKAELDSVLGEYCSSFSELMDIPGSKVNPRKDAPTYLEIMTSREVTAADFHARYFAAVESASEPKYVQSLANFMSNGRYLVPVRPQEAYRNIDITTNPSPTPVELTDDARTLATRFND